MAALKASGEAGKGADRKESLKDICNNFETVRNPILHSILFLLPWLILLIIIYILANLKFLTEVLSLSSVVMFISGMLTAALSLFAFQVLMKKIPETFCKIWNKNIIVEASFSDSPEKIVEGRDSRTTDKASKQLEERFSQFMQKLRETLNSPYQWIWSAGFALLVFFWIDVVFFWNNAQRYFSLFKDMFTFLMHVLNQTTTWELFKLFIYENLIYFIVLLELLIDFFVAFIIGLMAWRMVTTSIYVWKLGKEFYLEPLLGHPDEAGGLSPLGNLCLWNALIITIPAIYLGGWILLGIIIEYGILFLGKIFSISDKLKMFDFLISWLYFMKTNNFVIQSTYFAPIFIWLLLILVPFALVTFLLPLWKVHRIMEEWRKEKLIQFDHLAYSINQLESKLLNEAEKLDPKEFETLQKELEMMQQVYIRNEKLPVWPFNMEIIRKFLVSQTLPALSIIISQVTSFIKDLQSVPK